MSIETIQILLVEDNPSDVELTIEAMRDTKVQNRLSVVSDGVDALAYLRRQGPYEVASRPDLVILDLNLPRMDGKEVLAAIRADPHLRGQPVVVLTTSRSESDILRSYELGANCFITKPLRLSEFMEVVRGIENFWMTIACLLPKDGDSPNKVPPTVPGLAADSPIGSRHD